MAIAPALASASVALNSSAMYAGQAIGAASGGWLIARDGMDTLHWAGLAGMLLAMGASAWATTLPRHPSPLIALRDNPPMTPTYTTVGVVGAGAMGRGIAQIAAQAGSTVKLYDTQPQAIAKARDELFNQWDRLLEKGRMDQAAVQACKQRLQVRRQPAGVGRLRSGGRAVVERLQLSGSLDQNYPSLVDRGIA